MKTWKLVSGILSIIMFVFVTFQSCAAGISNSIEDNGEVGGSAGIIVAIMLLAGGIVSIATRNSKGKGGNIAVIVLFGLGAIHNGWKLHRPYNLGSLVCNLCSISTYFNDKKAKTDRRKLIKTAILKQIRGQRIKLKELIPM